MTDTIIDSYWKGYEDAVRLLKRGLASGLDPLAVVGCLEGAMSETRGNND